MVSLPFQTLVGLGILTLEEELTPVGCFLEEWVEVDLFTPGEVFRIKCGLDKVRTEMWHVQGPGRVWDALSDILLHRFVQYGIPSNPVEVYVDPLKKGHPVQGCITLEDHAGITIPTHPRSFGMYLHTQREKEQATIGLGMLGHLAFHRPPMWVKKGPRDIPPRGFDRGTWPCLEEFLEPHVVWEYRYRQD